MTRNASSRRIATIRDEFAPIEVVGAGPAGLSAAITLARSGKQVLLHEAQREVGHRFQGDLQGLENWSGKRNVLDVLRAAGITTDFATAPCTHGIGFDAWDRRYPLCSSEPICYLVERGPDYGSLDRTLLDQALSLGVEVHFGSRKDHLSGAGILATGPHSASAIAVGYHFETSLADGFWLVLDDALAPGGYAYLLVMAGRGTVKSCNQARQTIGLAMDQPQTVLPAQFRCQPAAFDGGLDMAFEESIVDDLVGVEGPHAGADFRFGAPRR
jgi:hypothetical protein